MEAVSLQIFTNEISSLRAKGLVPDCLLLGRRHRSMAARLNRAIWNLSVPNVIRMY